MIIMGLDISTQSTGWSIFDDNKLIDSGVSVSSKTNGYDRINKITADLRAIVEKYNPDYIITEEPVPAFSGGNIHVYQLLTFCHGSIALMLHEYKKEMHWVTAAHWRKEVGIKTGPKVKRAALKEASIARVKELFDIDTKSDDLAEGILVGYSEAKNHVPALDWE